MFRVRPFYTISLGKFSGDVCLDKRRERLYQYMNHTYDILFDNNQQMFFLHKKGNIPDKYYES